MILWSILNQNYLVTRVHLYIWMAVGVLLFLVFAGILSFEEAMLSIFIGGFATLFLVWLLIEARRIWLLRLRDPKLRAVAHEAMMAYIYSNPRIHNALCREEKDFSCGVPIHGNP